MPGRAAWRAHPTFSLLQRIIKKSFLRMQQQTPFPRINCATMLSRHNMLS